MQDTPWKGVPVLVGKGGEMKFWNLLLTVLCSRDDDDEEDPLTKDSDGDTIPDSWDLNPYSPDNGQDDNN